MQNVLAHVRRLWPDWKVLTPLPFVVYPLIMFLRGDHRWDYIAVMVVVPFLAYTNATTKKLYVGAYPIGLVGLIFDSMRYVRDVGITADRVHLCDLRASEMRFFSVTLDGRQTTYHDWLQAHATPLLDGYFAIPYGTFIFASFAFAFYLYRRDFARMQRFTWAFLAMNVAAFVTYHLYPAAPPWYYHAHGCTVDLGSHASEGPNLARVDQWLGVAYFGGMYGRSSDVFGAIPSLHCAYPLLIFLEGWSVFTVGWRVASGIFAASMCVAAVYLDHHWVTDVFVGLTYGGLAFVVGRVLSARWRRAGAPEIAAGAAEARSARESGGLTR